MRTPDDTKIIRLPGSKLEDLGKPTHDGQNMREEEMTQLVSAPPVPQLPPLPKEAPPSMTMEKTPEKPPEQAPLKTHTMTIVQGEYVQKAVFTMDPIDKVWTNGSLNNSVDDAPPRRRPSATPGGPETLPTPIPDSNGNGPRGRSR